MLAALVRRILDRDTGGQLQRRVTVQDLALPPYLEALERCTADREVHGGSVQHVVARRSGSARVIKRVA